MIAILSAATGRFVARVPAFVDSGDYPSRPRTILACHGRHFHSDFRGAHRGYSARTALVGPYAPSEASVALPPSGLISTRTRGRTAVAVRASRSLLWSMNSDPAGPLARLFFGSTLRRAFRSLDRLLPSPGARLGSQRLF